MMSPKHRRNLDLLPPTFGEPPEVDPARTVAVLMSGGVDSSVTAVLLRDAGWDIVGVTMKIPVLDARAERRPCCGMDAARVCRDLAIPHYFVDTDAAFRADVIEPFRRAYCEGRTPSPCIECNTRLKFTQVWDLLRERLGIQHLATGHYARIDAESRLKRAKDIERDQSYFLYGIPRERLASLHFPLGDLKKTEVRRHAAERRIFVSGKPDSMDLCFAAQGDYRALLSDVPPRPGPILDLAGKRLGEHAGLHSFTPGQRRGLGISSSERLFVIKLDPKQNAVIVGPREAGYEARVRAVSLNRLEPERLRPGERLRGKIRSVGEPEPCVIAETGPDALEVRFDPPVFAPAPGQHLVLYDDDDATVAGGEIADAERP